MAFGRGHSALSFNITRKRVIDFNKLGKISVEALNKAWNEIAHRIKTYAEQEAPVYTWNLKSTIRIIEQWVASSITPWTKYWNIIAWWQRWEGIHPVSRRPIKKYVDYAEYQERYWRKSWYMSKALNDHWAEYMNILKRYINGKMLVSQSSWWVFFNWTKK